MLPSTAVAVVPEEYYRKPKGIQFKKSFRKRADAVRYAQQRGYRLVIACEAEGGYDVMCRPDRDSGPKVSFDLVVDRGELVAVPRSLTSTGQKPAESRTPRKTPWNWALRWLRTYRQEPARGAPPASEDRAITQEWVNEVEVA